jgi:hypothetical protein
MESLLTGGRAGRRGGEKAVLFIAERKKIATFAA